MNDLLQLLHGYDVIAPELVEGLQDNGFLHLLHDGGGKFFALGGIKFAGCFRDTLADFLVGYPLFLGPVLDGKIDCHGFAQVLAQLGGLPLLGIGIVRDVF